MDHFLVRERRARDLLADSGHTRVCAVIHGCEGELSEWGWRNANGVEERRLPWSYEPGKKKMYFPR